MIERTSANTALGAAAKRAWSKDYRAGWNAALENAATEAERWIDDHDDDDARQETADWLRSMKSSIEPNAAPVPHPAATDPSDGGGGRG